MRDDNSSYKNIKDGKRNLDGIINVYKEAGFTSHDVVAKLRGILRQKKIGHTGTLDPEATGVLPVCCGKATKVCELLTDKDKSYRAVCRLGVETDTQDMTGTVLNECDTDMITEEQLRDCVNSFVGETEQVPPMYSALKINGKKLYELAREGKTVERKPRKITISEIDIVDINLEEKIFTMDVTCSKGTYIRTLCHDIGKKLGVCATMEKLMRTRVSVFKIEDALTLNDIEILSKEKPEIFREKVYSVDSLFDYSKVNVAGDGIRYLQNGNTLKAKDFKQDVSGIKQDEKILVYDENNNFKAVYQKNENDFKVFKMF